MNAFILVSLLACVAVSQAAFSAKLVDRAQPALQQAMFKVRLVSRTANSDLQTEFIQQLQDQANEILGQIQNGVNLATEVVQQLVAEFNNVVEQLQQAGGSLAGNITDIISGVLGNLANLWGSLFGRSNDKNFLTNWIQSNFGTYITHLQGLIGQLGINQLIQDVLNQHLPSFVADWIIENILNHNASVKGFWGNIWGGISGGFGAIVEQLGELTQQIINGASGAFENLQTIASNFLAEALAEGSTITSAAAEQMLNFLRPYAADLGQLYVDLEAQLSAIISGISGIIPN